MPFVQWHPWDICTQGTSLLLPAPSSCPPTHYPHFQEKILLQHCPAVRQTRPPLCPTPGQIKKRTALPSKEASPGKTQQGQLKVFLEHDQVSAGCNKPRLFLTLLLIPLPAAHLSSRCSPQPLRASLMSPSTSSFRRALSSNRTTLSVSPVVPKAEQAQSYSGQRSAAPGSPDINFLDNLSLDPDDGIGMMQDPQDEDPPDIQEVNRLFSSSHLKCSVNIWCTVQMELLSSEKPNQI